MKPILLIISASLLLAVAAYSLVLHFSERPRIAPPIKGQIGTATSTEHKEYDNSKINAS